MTDRHAERSAAGSHLPDVAPATRFGRLWRPCAAIAPLITYRLAELLTDRGLLYRFFRQHMRTVLAALLSAFIFALMHMHWVTGLWAFAVGISAAMCFEHTRSVWASILVHGCFNAVPVGLAALRANPDDPCGIWLALATAAILFTVASRNAHRALWSTQDP